MSTQRVICINNEGYPVALAMFTTYETIPDDQAEKRGLIRVIDESGEDYLYQKSRFVSADVSLDVSAVLPEEARQAWLSGGYIDPLTGREFRFRA